MCDLETREIFVSRDVVFCVDIYPFGIEPKGFEPDNASGSPPGLPASCP